MRLQGKYGENTTYFGDWLGEIDRLPGSTWGVFWLSDYDVKREEEARDGELGKGEEAKEKGLEAK